MVFSRVCNLQEILSLLTTDHDNTTYLQKNLREQSLLSFIAPSHMVAPERILVNTSFPFYLSTLHNTQEPLNNMEMDMEIDTPRCYGTLWTLTFFFFFYLFFLILYFFSFKFLFLFLLVMMKRHVTLQSHDMSHDVTS